MNKNDGIKAENGHIDKAYAIERKPGQDRIGDLGRVMLEPRVIVHLSTGGSPMASTAIQQAQPYTAWPPDDTEESVVGTDRHQMTIMNVRFGINELAHAAIRLGQPLPWQALSQTNLMGCRRRDGTFYTTMPDVFVYRKAIDQDRGSVSVWKDGPPSLIIEIASESTYSKDLDAQAGKAWTYEQTGIREYMVVDPTTLYLPTPVIAWHAVEGRYRKWEPDSAGLWWSEEIPVGIGVAGGAVTIYDREGQGQLHEGEVLTSIANARAEAAQARAEVAELRRKLVELEGR